jgi:MFS family permease
MSGVGAAATLSGLGAALVITRTLTGLHVAPRNIYRADFYVAGTAIGIAALLCMRLSAHAESRNRVPFLLRREYGLYYLLTFLEGCRRQIFAIFAQYALILVYHVRLERMLMIQFVNAILIAITAPSIGKLVDKHGERGPLTFYSIGLIVVFLGYASVHNVNALYALFLIDNVLFTFGVGFTTYLHRIVRPNELTACLSMGVTMNHIASVTVPIGGAILWKASGNYQLPFWVGVCIATVSLFATRWLPRSVASPRPEVVLPETPPQEETPPVVTP